MAARPRIQAMMQDAVTAGLLLQRPLEARLDVVTETATSTNIATLDDEDRAVAKLYVQKGGPGCMWQQTTDGFDVPSVTNPTVSELERHLSGSQDDDSDMDFSGALGRAVHRSSKRSFHGCLIGLDSGA